jgi:hypothetical protein
MVFDCQFQPSGPSGLPLLTILRLGAQEAAHDISGFRSSKVEALPSFLAERLSLPNWPLDPSKFGRPARVRRVEIMACGTARKADPLNFDPLGSLA